MYKRFIIMMTTLSLSLCAVAKQDNALILNLGYGPQPSAEVSQRNHTVGFDYEFYRYQRSERQRLSLGVSYTYLATDHQDNSSLHAISIYPQLTLLAKKHLQWQPWFFVRALGPTYLSEKTLGTRHQAKHFAFQAQVGLGVDHLDSNWMFALSYKHFSNANLYQPNDGFDVPLVINVGKRF
ncbi:acyloxyacyl hydrolase [Agarivorans sp. TSD2052]|uniref:acyloxyacyl hydrolase n=1 Tax=Agarivorans sp. TSD2052 TaxID=2937286 RepID=UPI00200F4031|nr:acyloxyacyl hydrolase [Agarivorans sp. TSD2052]UPW19356.1 acyloxyacyl hydrolase [Agarivorans sp. TSD2052]